MAKLENSSKFIPHQQYFQGGATTDFKMGIANSFYSSHNLDFRTFPSQMSVLPASRSIATNLPDCITALDQDLNGVRWGVGDQGYVYRIDTSDNVSNIAQLTENGSAGILYSQITDQLYIPGQSSVSMYGRVTKGTSAEPIFRQNIFAESASIAPGCTQLYNYSDDLFDTGIYRNNAPSIGIAQGITDPSQVTDLASQTQTIGTTTIGGQTYTLPNTIIEDGTPTSFNNGCFFLPDIEPFYSIAVYVDNVGTGDWTLTLHDSLNNELAAVAIASADMVTGWNNFIFGSQIRAFVNASNTGIQPTYHFHLTSSVSNDTATVWTFYQNDLSSCDFLLFAYRLIETNNGWHPTTYFTGTGQPLMCIGNGNYLSTYNFGNDANPSNGQWQRHVLSFKPGEEVCGISANNQYLVIATERKSNDATRNSQLGCLYFWDGSTSNPAIIINLPMGSPYGLYSMNNVTYFACAGALYAWSGGQTVLKVRKLAYQNTDYMNTEDQTKVYPNGFTSRYNILMMGYPGYTTDPNIDYGIWSWGAVELTYPNSYGYSYSQSHGILNYTSQNQLKLGCCENFVDAMYSSWQYTDANDVVHSGLDVVDNSSAPASFADYDSLIFDGGVVYKEKMAVRYKINFEALPSGWTLTPRWTIDRGAEQYGSAVGESATEAFVEWNNSRFHELSWGFRLENDGTATAPPVILGISPEIDPLSAEVDLEPGEV